MTKHTNFDKQGTVEPFSSCAVRMDKHNEKLPVWMLTPGEEKEARKRWKDYAYHQCDDAVKS